MKAGWKINELSAVSAINYGFTESASFEPVGPKFLRITDIQNDSVNWADVPYCNIDLKEREKFLLHSGDIVFARTGATTGKSFLVSAPPEAVFASYLIRLRILDTNLSPEFLAYFFQTAGYWQSIKDGSAGSAQGGFNASKLGALKIPTPPIEEQRCIVTLLDEAFADIATAKANAEKNLQNARDLYRSFASDIFSSHAVSWPKRTLNQISTNLDNKRIPITKSDRQAGAYPYYGASGIVDYVAEYIFEGDTLLISEDGANLLARSTPIAFPASGRYWVNNHAHILKFEDVATQQFVELYLESIPLDEYITGAAQPKLNQKALNSIPIPIPDSKIEQQKIVNQLTAVQDLSEQLTFIQEQKLTALDDLKKSLLHQAFSGQL